MSFLLTCDTMHSRQQSGHRRINERMSNPTLRPHLLLRSHPLSRSLSPFSSHPLSSLHFPEHLGIRDAKVWQHTSCKLQHPILYESRNPEDQESARDANRRRMSHVLFENRYLKTLQVLDLESESLKHGSPTQTKTAKPSTFKTWSLRNWKRWTPPKQEPGIRKDRSQCTAKKGEALRTWMN